MFRAGADTATIPPQQQAPDVSSNFMATLFNLKYSVVILVLLSCRSHEIIQDSNKIFQAAQPSDSLGFYFPESLNRPSTRHHIFDNFEQNWFSSTLYSFKEPILKTKTDDETVYRFLWLRSFNEPVCYSLKKFNGEYFLSTKTLDRCPAWYPHIEAKYENDKKILDTVQKADRIANITFKEIIKVTKSEWLKFENLLSKSKFWSLPSLDPYPSSTDGAEWIIEAYKEKIYHFVVRQTSFEIKDVGIYLISLSNLNVPKDQIY